MWQDDPAVDHNAHVEGLIALVAGWLSRIASHEGLAKEAFERCSVSSLVGGLGW